ncbi:Solute carrier family 16 protein [Fasciola gigantica]|uniref:Solute carrier family 16 protein n=1 Tax=Fasciola gigantica TaxID=46835 RepID=A0A504YN95_FASGI|nr:Solute carrier family 16 protein [Fasciola gigantica]
MIQGKPSDILFHFFGMMYKGTYYLSFRFSFSQLIFDFAIPRKRIRCIGTAAFGPLHLILKCVGKLRFNYTIKALQRSTRKIYMDVFQKCLILFGGFLAYFLADGYTYSVMFYSHLLNKFGMSSASTAVLPGLLYAIPQISGFFLCPLLEEVGYSSGAAWGALLLSFSCMASAFTPNMQLLYLTLGVFTSLGLQLTYSSAIMAVTTIFSDTKMYVINYGLALGLTMCGSGIGSFAFNPFVAWLLDTWTWQGAMIIQSGILLNSLIASACFHYVDAIRFSSRTFSGTNQASMGDEPLRLCQRDSRNTTRFALRVNPKPCAGFCTPLASSLHRIVLPAIWRNAALVVFILANGLIGAAIVVPWTFTYDHLLVSLGGSDDLDANNASQVAWMPSLIGMGSLFGYIFDRSGSYHGAFIFASCLPLLSAMLIAVQQCSSRSPISAG